MTLAFIAILFGVQGQSLSERPWPVRFAYGAATRLGSAKVIFSVVFFLALITYFDLNDEKTKWFVLFWLTVILTNELRIPQFLEQLFRSRRSGQNKFLGKITRFVEPNIVRFSIPENVKCGRGDLVAFTKDSVLTDDCPLAYVINHRRTASTLEAEAMLLSSGFSEGAVDDRTTVISVSDEDPRYQDRIAAAELFRFRERKVGFAKNGSDVGRLRMELVGSSSLEEGHLLKLIARQKDVYYQVTNAELCEEPTLDGSKRVFTLAAASQLGTWVAESRSFQPYSWVSPESAPVYAVLPEGEADVLGAGLTQTIGVVPNSSFPVDVRLGDLALYHSAILGVTGTGKSYLAFDLVERLAAAGTKVLCLDVTGDYARHLQEAVKISSSSAIQPFLSDATAPQIGVVEFTEATHPILATLRIAQSAMAWCKANRSDEDVINPRPKVLLLLEESHTLVPEWNFNPEKTHQDSVSKTAQVVLQARKYGLGFCVITQRTANVTKSILNQCNSIFSFQAFDETSFDFLSNYMGRSYVRALPNLQERHGVFVGKASVSPRPLIVRFSEQARTLREDPMPEYEPPT